jgi:uncharacterized protein (TIGR00297 family)
MRCIGIYAASNGSNRMTITLILASFAIWLNPNGLMLVSNRAVPAVAITLAFGLVAWGLRGVTFSGAIAGSIVTFIICIAAGPGGFTVVLTVFVLTLFATRFGLHRKFQNGIAEKREGRGASQVVANVGAAAIVATPAIFVPRAEHFLMVAMTAALCEAAADTVSSEIGQAAGRRAYMITGFTSVPAGTNGAISVAGTISGILAAFMVAFVAASFDVIHPRWILTAVLCGVLGMFLDSFLGATLERPGRLGNDSVNFTSTVFAACLTLVIGLVMLSSW